MVVNQLSISATFLGLLKRGIPWSIETVYPMAQWSFHRARDTRFCQYLKTRTKKKKQKQLGFSKFIVV